MIIVVLKVLLSMYLAGVIINAIQIHRAYIAVEETDFHISDFLMFFCFMFIKPQYVVMGTINAIRDWDWMEGKIRKNDQGQFEPVGDNKNEVS